MRANLLPILLPVILISACQKDYNRDTAISETYTLTSAMASVDVVPKTVTISAATGGTFTGSSGSRYVFPANCFVTAGGAPVTGDVEVTASDYLTKSDMLFSKILPVSADGPLISGGESSVSVLQKGRELRMDPTKQYQIYLPQQGTPVAGMNLFIGEKDSLSGQVIWQQSTDTTSSITYIDDTIVIETNDLGLVNADKFTTPNVINNNPNVGVSINVFAPERINNSFVVFALLDGQNTIFSAGAVINGTISNSQVYHTPTHFVAMGVINGSLYGGIFAATPTSGKTYTIVVAKTSPSAFRKKVEALP